MSPTPNLIFVAGMHRSGTSAISGSLEILGATHSRDLFSSDTANLKGYFESRQVVELNDEILRELGRSWNDCRSVPAVTESIRRKFMPKIKSILEAANVGDGVFVLKDPRLSLLPSLWIDGAREVGLEPAFLIALREVEASANSIIRRDGLSEEAATSIVLRYLLDAELGTRDVTRAFLEIEKLIEDPVREFMRVQTELGIVWPAAPDAKAGSLREFLDPGMLKKPAPLEVPQTKLAKEALHSLKSLAQTPRDKEPLVSLDAISSEFALSCEAIHDRMCAQQLRLAIERKWELDAMKTSSDETLHGGQRKVRHPSPFSAGALRFAARLVNPLSPRTARRFRNSASKRDPIHLPVSEDRLQHKQAVTGSRTATYVPFEPPTPKDHRVRVLAHYLPQFHPIEENNEWWGHGFTEWTNVTRAVPNFQGHYQPHLPDHMGFYDLRLPEVMSEQMRIAKAYGIHGFSYYFYWFSGKILLERPLRQMLEDKSIDMPFCLNWANENWTRNWSGDNRSILMQQDYSLDDATNFLNYIRPYMEDSRYIRISGKPVLIVYKASVIPMMTEIIDVWRETVASWGEDGIYLIGADTGKGETAQSLGFDAGVQFPPHKMHHKTVTDDLEGLRPGFFGEIYDYKELADFELTRTEPSEKLFRSTMLSWDNTARRGTGSRIFSNFSIETYQKWMTHICRNVLKDDKYSEDEKIVFVNAWNEWAEGAHLEPDQQLGFSYLQATYDSLLAAEES